MKLNIRPLSKEEATLFYSNDAKDKELGCIGHLRGDFGHRGKEFWHTWFDHQGELNTPEFKADIGTVINELRTHGPLKNLTDMAKYCHNHQEAQMPGASQPDTYGFCIDTEHYRYCVRCFPQQGDNNFYIYCYKNSNEQQLEITESGQHKSASKNKRHEPER